MTDSSLDDDKMEPQGDTTRLVVHKGEMDGIQHLDEMMNEFRKVVATSKNSSALRSCKRYGLALGFVIGCFIQMASMGAFFLYRSLTTTATTANPQESSSQWNLDSTQSQIIFSMTWSAFTSTLGVVTVILLSSLIQRVQTIMSREKADETLLLHMECAISLGLVLGLITSCTVKNYVLGGSEGLWQSFMVLGLTILCYMWQLAMIGGLALAYGCISKYCRQANEAGDEGDDEEPLGGHFEVSDDSTVASDLSSSMSLPLLRDRHGRTEQDDMIISVAANGDSTNPQAVVNRSYRTASVILGLIVGCFIQLSCLGANYLLFFLWHFDKDEKQNNRSSLQTAIMFNLVWDLVTCGLGVLILFFIRRLLQVQWSRPIPTSTKMAVEEQDAAATDASNNSYFVSFQWTMLLLNIESFFAVGALVGVNMSWVATNYLMGFQSNMVHSLVMLIISLLWYGTIVSTTTEAHQEMDDDDDMDNNDYNAMA